MKLHTSKPGMGRIVALIISIVSIVSISATFVLASETLFLPLVFHQNAASTQPATPLPDLAATPTLTATPGPSPTPKPPETLQLMVTPSNPDKDWALAFFAKSYNSSGRPVMQIYPSDTAPSSERIMIPRGEIVLALKTPVTADGGGKYWQLVDYKGEKGEDLFLKAGDVTKVTAAEPGS